jgi:hypothetical protein
VTEKESDPLSPAPEEKSSDTDKSSSGSFDVGFLRKGPTGSGGSSPIDYGDSIPLTVSSAAPPPPPPPGKINK